jgi:P27 family predicted phage terminase small subunit
MGRLQKPSELKRLAGNPGKRKLNRKEPKPSNTPEPPDIMTTYGLIVWKRTLASMPHGVYTGADNVAIANYCEQVAILWLLTEAFEKNPMLMSTGSTGQPTINPVIKEMRAQAAIVNQLGARLGLDPISRQNIATNGSQQEDEFSDLIH